MASGVSTPFIRRPIATTLLMIGVFLVGLAAYPMLPVAPLPQIDFPTIQVSASLPGASPETMASSVAQPLERQFAQISGVSQLTSSSALGSTTVTIQFDLDRNIDAAAQDVQAAINAASGQLPKNLPTPPTYRKVNPADRPIILFAVSSDTMPMTQVDDIADTKIAQQVSQISGVGQVSIGGERKPAVRVQIDPAKLAAKGLSLEDVRAKIAVSTVDLPKGTIQGARRSYTIYNNDQLTTAKPWNDVIVAYRNGAPVRVSDLGQAIDGPEDVTKLGWSENKPAIVLVVFKQPGANVIETVERIKGQLTKLRAAIPPAVKIEILSDRTQTIRASVHDVQFTLLLTIALVVMVIFLFLRNFWATAIPSVTVPLSLLGTAALMYIVGYTLDNLSLMALTIAVGFVVDDAIVMLENIVRHMEDGEKPLEAAFKGAGEIGFTIVSISLSLVAVFIPLLLMGGIFGRLFREFAVTVTMTIAVSAIVSLTLTPMMASRLLKDERHVRHGRLYRIIEKFFDRMLAGYMAMLDVVLKHRFITLMTFFGTIALSAYLFIVIPKGFFPNQDTGFIIATTEAAQSVSFPEMARIQKQFGELVLQDPAVETVGMSIGTGGGATGTNSGRMFITLKPRDERDVGADEFIRRIRRAATKIEGAAIYLQNAQDITVGGRTARTQYQYTLTDADLDELNEWAPKILAAFKKVPELQDVASDQQSAGTTLTLTIDRDQASRFGIDPQLIDDTLYDAFGQRQVTQYFTQLNSYHVVMEILPELQEDPDTLNKFYLKSPLTNQQVPLATFVHWTTEKVKPLSISHQGQFPATTLSFNLSPGVSLGEATVAIDNAMRGLSVPPALSGAFQGNAAAFQESLKSEPYLITAALIVIYIILGMLYESTIHPLTILSTLPSAGLGAVATLMLFGFDFSLIALIGILLLIGIVKKNGIMLVDFAIHAERDRDMSPAESIREACRLRFRPIMMTTMAAILGGVPLMLGTGTGSELRQPLGYAMVGGLIVSQALTLFSTPVVYLYLDRLSNWLQGTNQVEETHVAAAEEKVVRPAA